MKGTKGLKHFLCFALLLLTLLFGSEAAFADSERSHLSTDWRVVEARQRVSQADYGQALALLRPLVGHHPDQTDILFLVGLASMRLSQSVDVAEEKQALLEEAISAFHTVLITRPELERVRLELAHAFFLNRQDDLARRHFERVLGGASAQAVIVNVQRFLNIIRARKRWDGHFGFRIEPDSNINTASTDNIIYIGDLPFRLDSNAAPQSGIGFSFWGGGHYQYPIGKDYRLRVGFDAARKEYKGRAFDQSFLETHIGPRWLIDANTEVSVLANLRGFWRSGNTESKDVGLRLLAQKRLSRAFILRARFDRHYRSYERVENLDGPITRSFVHGIWQINPTIRGEMTLGHGRESPELFVRRNTSHRIGAGASFTLPRGFSIGLHATHYWTQYKGNWAPFTLNGASRRDKTWNIRAPLYNRALTFVGFSPQVTIIHEHRQSNAQLHSYQRTRGELQFVRQF